MIPRRGPLWTETWTFRREAEERLRRAVEARDFGTAEALVEGGLRGGGQELQAHDLLRELAIGKVAPEIEVEDIDRKPIKLADYRGKVVVLDFRGNW